VFADHLQEYGKGGLKAMPAGRTALAGAALLVHDRIRPDGTTAQGLRVYGAGILSSGGEITYALTSDKSVRIPFELERCMRTLFKIDSYQGTYFVIDSFRQLFDETAPDFTTIYPRLHAQPTIAAGELLDGEHAIAPNA
jgi:phenylalanine-4-hydroxylase